MIGDIATMRIPPPSAEGLKEAGPSRLTVQGAAGEAGAHQAFEAFVLQGFIEEMLPKGADSVFGSGIAGGVWKSMLAEKLAAELSRSATLGIAEKLAGPVPHNAPHGAPHGAPHSAP